MAGAVVVVDVDVLKSRNLPLLTLSRYQSAWVFPSKKYDPIVSTDDEKKAYFGAFFLLTYAWNSRWALGNWERNGVHQKISFPPRPSFSFSVLKNSVLHERTSSLLTQTYILCGRDIFTIFFVKMISQNFSWKWFHEIFAGTESLVAVVLPAVLVLSAYNFLLFDFLKG